MQLISSTFRPNNTSSVEIFLKTLRRIQFFENLLTYLLDI